MPEIVANKPFWKSKTFWFNTIGVAQLVLPVVGIPAIPMDEQTTGVIMGAGNVLLRTITKGKISLKSEE